MVIPHNETYDFFSVDWLTKLNKIKNEKETVLNKRIIILIRLST